MFRGRAGNAEKACCPPSQTRVRVAVIRYEVKLFLDKLVVIEHAEKSVCRDELLPDISGDIRLLPIVYGAFEMKRFFLQHHVRIVWVAERSRER